MQKISFQQNFEFSKSIEWFKCYNFFSSMYKKKFKNDGDEDDCQRPVQ